MRGVLDARRAGEQSRDEPADRLSDGPRTDRHRGQSHVLGLVLLVGIVAMGSTLVLLFGASGLEAYESAAEIEHAEHSLLEFTHNTKTTVATGQSPSDVSLGPFDRGHVAMRDEAGRVTITRDNDSGGTEVLYNESLGTLTYVNGDTEIAYQGGGVWRTDGGGSTTVSEPGIDYRNGTLTFSIVHLDGSQVRGTVIDGTVRRAATPEQVDLDGRSNRTRASVAVQIAIESAYCSAWEQELEDSLEGNVTESCEAGEPQRVRIQLISPRENSRVLDSAVIGETVEAGFNSKSKQPIDGDVRAGTIDDEWMVKERSPTRTTTTRRPTRKSIARSRHATSSRR